MKKLITIFIQGLSSYQLHIENEEKITCSSIRREKKKKRGTLNEQVSWLSKQDFLRDYGPKTPDIGIIQKKEN